MLAAFDHRTVSQIMSNRISISAFVMAVDFCVGLSFTFLPAAAASGDAIETPLSVAGAEALLFAGFLVCFGLIVAIFCDFQIN